MKLSILVAVLRDRPGPVIDKLIAQAEPHRDVEVLWFGDNRRRSIGLKRQALLNAAQGCWVATVDDDDDVANNYLDRILAVIRTSMDAVVTFDAIVKYEDGSPDCYVACQVGYPNESAVPGGRIKRAAWPCHAWRRSLARQSFFPDSMWGEDWEWARRIQPNVFCPRIAEPLYYYNERVK